MIKFVGWVSKPREIIDRHNYVKQSRCWAVLRLSGAQAARKPGNKPKRNPEKRLQMFLG